MTSRTEDLEHLKLLSLFHYVVAAPAALVPGSAPRLDLSAPVPPE